MPKQVSCSGVMKWLSSVKVGWSFWCICLNLIYKTSWMRTQGCNPVPPVCWNLKMGLDRFCGPSVYKIYPNQCHFFYEYPYLALILSEPQKLNKRSNKLVQTNKEGSSQIPFFLYIFIWILGGCFIIPKYAVCLFMYLCFTKMLCPSQIL